MDDPQYREYIKKHFRYIDETGQSMDRIDNLANPALRPNG